MQIRKATDADLPEILGMGERFYNTTSYRGFAGYDHGSTESLVRMLIDTGVFLVADSGDGLIGMVGLAVAPFMFNNAYRVAYEVVWWVNPESRGGLIAARLLKAADEARKEAGCTAIQMVHMADSPPQAGELYRRFGYRHTETSWTKVD